MFDPPRIKLKPVVVDTLNAKVTSIQPNPDVAIVIMLLTRLTLVSEATATRRFRDPPPGREAENRKVYEPGTSVPGQYNGLLLRYPLLVNEKLAF